MFAILFNEDRIKTFYCDQTNSIEIQKMWKNINNNFDIIIDDASHISENIIMYYLLQWLLIY